MATSSTPDSSVPAIEPDLHVPQRRRDRFLPRFLSRASVGRFYGSGGMAAAPDSPAQEAAELRAMKAGSHARNAATRPDPPDPASR